MAEISLPALLLLLATGYVAGVINTLAGGGSNLTLPALMVLGLPADVANATNRVGVLLQSVAGVHGFHRYGKLAWHDAGAVLLPTLLGGLVGAIVATALPVALLKPLLLTAMVGMSLLILVRPATVAPPEGTEPLPLRGRPGAWVALFATGIYGGFVQAGVGFVLIAALAGTLRYDLVRSNALKMLCTGAFTLVALLVFIGNGLVAWLPGLALGASTMLGATHGVHLAIRVRQQTLKWFLFLMTLCASIAAMWH
ncbi:MAG TPA: sulfite exporter TauE/SafE family protein [Pseudomonadales bacterium]|nr:sulfite exporter TauE/SafE family protein [Pseudomonadales bacterium]HNC70407.1 sulfite exporter TauE/SafE family protein [Pseudomonadales bacterium]